MYVDCGAIPERNRNVCTNNATPPAVDRAEPTMCLQPDLENNVFLLSSLGTLFPTNCRCRCGHRRSTGFAHRWRINAAAGVQTGARHRISRLRVLVSEWRSRGINLHDYKCMLDKCIEMYVNMNLMKIVVCAVSLFNCKTFGKYVSRAARSSWMSHS